MTDRPLPQAKNGTAPAEPGGRPAGMGMMGRGGPNMGMFMGKAPRAEDTRGTLLKLWRYLAHHRRSLIVTAILVVFSTGLNLLWPYLMGVAIDSSWRAWLADPACASATPTSRRACASSRICFSTWRSR